MVVSQIVEYLHHATRGEALDVVDTLLGETGELVLRLVLNLSLPLWHRMMSMDEF